MRTANTAAGYISDEFMKRVERSGLVSLRSGRDSRLVSSTARSSPSATRNMCEKAEKGEMRTFKKMPARELWRQDACLALRPPRTHGSPGRIPSTSAHSTTTPALSTCRTSAPRSVCRRTRTTSPSVTSPHSTSPLMSRTSRSTGRSSRSQCASPSASSTTLSISTSSPSPRPEVRQGEPRHRPRRHGFADVFEKLGMAMTRACIQLRRPHLRVRLLHGYRRERQPRSRARRIQELRGLALVQGHGADRHP
jgi:hypothetical protein